MPVQLPTLSIFVSSTWHDLQPERRAVVEALNRLRLMKFVGMEYSGAWSEPPLHASLKEARECDAYVGIFGGRYGSGITAEEYRAARGALRWCFIYFKDELSATLEVDAEPEKREQLQALKEELNCHHTCQSFTTPEDLAAKVTADLSNWYARDFLPTWADEVGRRRVPGFAPYQLQSPLRDFVGREREIEALVKALEPSELASIADISGMGGVGKSALALFVANKLRADYPHAQLVVNLHSMRHEPQPVDLAEALKRCLERLGVNTIGLTNNVDELSKIYCHSLSGKRALIVLDDAATESQVKAFIPPSGCALLITSREQLCLPAITHIRLNPLDTLEASHLLTSIASRIAADEAEQIVRLCGHLPLALRAAASLLSVTKDLAPADYIRDLRDEQQRLKALDRKAEKILGIDVETTFNISYEHLGSEAKRIFRRLAVFPATFDKMAQEAICLDRSSEHLSDLVRLSLVFFDDRTSRYYLHDLVRLYAAQLLLLDERLTMGSNHASYYLNVARNIGELYEREATARQGFELFDLEWMNLQAGCAWAAEHSVGDDEAALSCLHYVDALKQLLYLRRQPQEQIKWLKSALAVSRRLKQRVTEGRYFCHMGTTYSLIEPRRAVKYYLRARAIAIETEDHFGKGNALGGLGNAYASLGQNELAIKYYKQCLLQLYELGDGRGAGRTLTNLGNIYTSRGQSRYATEFYRQALEVAREIGDHRGEAIALCKLGDEQTNSGQLYAALENYQQALSLMKETDDLRGQAAVLIGLGNAHSARGEQMQAFEFYQRALHISQEVGDLCGEGIALGSMGNEYANLGQLEEAIRYHKDALSISHQLGERPGEIQDLTNLGNAYYLLGDTQSALEFHHEVLSISREIRSDLYEGIALWNIAQTLAKSTEIETAKSYAAAAFEILDQLEHPLAEDARKFLKLKKRRMQAEIDRKGDDSIMQWKKRR